MQQKILDQRYELERKIGEGGMARVYVGRDLRLNRRVAVKVLHSQYASDSDFLNRFRHEAHAVAILSHPNVVDVYDVGQDGDIHYIVMEYVDGTDLKKLINQAAPLPVERAVAIAEAVANALEAAHRVGLVHRDIKPQNIIIAHDNDVRITDFGVAKSHLSTALTETGVTFGTVDYISPEQAQGKAATPRSDIYSLGVTLYEMLTGRLPFTGDNAVAVAMQHVSTPPPPPRRFNSLIPVQLEAVILRALAKDPAQRPQSAAELVQLLRTYRAVAQQDTMINISVPRRSSDTGQPRLVMTTPGNGNTAGRPVIPPPRPTPVRAPSQQGLGCGMFLVGMIILAGVLSVVFLFSTGALDGLFVGMDDTVSAPTRVNPTTITTPTITPAPTQALVAVPNLLNQSEAAARATLLQLQLVPVTDTARYNANVPAGLVLAQAVPAGTTLAPGQPVTYTLSLGPQLITLGDYNSRRLDRSREELAGLGLNVEVAEEPNAQITEGFIIRQSPNPGARLQPGDSVRLVVSIGDRVRFPDVVGMARSDAEAVLRNTDGLVLEYVDEQGRDRLPDFDSFFAGEVVSAQANGQPVRNGDYIPRGSQIVLGVRAEF